MTQEKFKALSTALEEEFPEGDVLFDGKDTISVKVHIFGCSGIRITVLNKEEGESWSTCIELKDACGCIWERQWADLEGQKQDLEDFIAALERLITIDEYNHHIDMVGDGTDIPEKPENYNDLALYPIDENGHAEIPAGTTRIQEEAFLNCSKLVSVTIPDTVREICGLAFGGCTNLASLDLPSSVRFIGPLAFFGCKSLASVVISADISLMIEERAFAGCISLTDVVFKNNPIKVIVPHAFEGCPCEDDVEKYRYFEFKSVKQMTKAVRDAIASGSLHFCKELDGRTLVYHTKKYKERIAFEYRNNKIFYGLKAHDTVYDSWTVHEEKALAYFFRLYESTH